jgi:ribosomal protein S10
MTYIKETQNRSSSKQDLLTLGADEDDAVVPSFFVHPPKRSRLTFLKAPMAHKTFSQEQFMSKSYNLTISFNSSFRKQLNIKDVNNSLYIALYLRNTCLPTETNLLFLKKLRMSITSKDTKFMSI